MKLVKNKVAEFRYKAGLTQTELAKALGLTKTCVFNWEHAIKQPDMKNQLKLIGFFNVAREDLFKYDCK